MHVLFLTRSALFILVAFVALVSLFFSREPDPVDLGEYEAGRLVYLARCQLCHGEQADGKGSLTRSVPGLYPRNFTDPKVADRDPEQLRAVVRHGGGAFQLDPMMPAWENILSSDDIDAVVYFVQSVSREGFVRPSPDPLPPLR
ncbi:MAG: cytochrome c [Rhodothermales bacterium]